MRKYGGSKKVRFIADITNQDIYVWDAHMAIHNEMERFIQQQGDNLGYRLIEDEGNIEGNKIDCGNVFKDRIENREDYRWMGKYFKI
jgi:hypothetical protein